MAIGNVTHARVFSLSLTLVYGKRKIEIRHETEVEGVKRRVNMERSTMGRKKDAPMAQL